MQQFFQANPDVAGQNGKIAQKINTLALGTLIRMQTRTALGVLENLLNCPDARPFGDYVRARVFAHALRP